MSEARIPADPISRTVEVFTVRGAMVAVVLYVAGVAGSDNEALADEMADVIAQALRARFEDKP
jgi:hypothetical protein